MPGWLDSAVGALQSGYVPGSDSAFPPYVPPPSQEQQSDDIWARIAAEEAAANAAADRRNAGGMRRAPIRGEQPFSDLMAPGVAMALGNGPRPPVDPGAYATTVGYDGPNWGYIPPSLQAAKAMTAPQQPPGAPPMATTAPAPPVAPGAPAPAMPPPQNVGPAPVPTDVSAQSRTPAPVTARPAPMGMVAPTVTGPAQSWGDRLNEAGPMLMAMGAGLAGPHGFGEGLQNAFANAAPYGAALQKRRQDLALQNQQQNLTIAGLRAKGVPEADIASAIGNPEVLKALVNQYYGKDKWDIKQTGEDAFGGKTYTKFNTITGETAPISQGEAETGVGSGSRFLADGVKEVNQGLVGDDYLKQFAPEVQSSVRSYLRGDSMPTGRQKEMQIIKRIAQKYGEDIGTPANDQAYYQRKAFQTSLGDTKSGVGMQAKGFQQGLQHMAQLSDKLVKLKNWGGFGLEPVANWENWIRNLSTSQQDIARGVMTDAQLLAGETGKLFSGSTGGGVREREEMAGRFGNPNMSGPAAAGSLESAMEAMQGGLLPLVNRRDQLFPGQLKPPGAEFVGADEKAAMEKIRRNIAILRGQQAEAAGGGAGGTVAPGAYIWDPQRGLVPK